MTVAARPDIHPSGALKVSVHVLYRKCVMSMHLGLTSFLYKLDERSKKNWAITQRVLSRGSTAQYESVLLPDIYQPGWLVTKLA